MLEVRRRALHVTVEETTHQIVLDRGECRGRGLRPSFARSAGTPASSGRSERHCAECRVRPSGTRRSGVRPGRSARTRDPPPPASRGGCERWVHAVGNSGIVEVFHTSEPSVRNVCEARRPVRLGPQSAVSAIDRATAGPPAPAFRDVRAERLAHVRSALVIDDRCH